MDGTTGDPPGLAVRLLCGLLDTVESGYHDSQAGLLGPDAPRDSPGWHDRVGRCAAYDHVAAAVRDLLEQNVEGMMATADTTERPPGPVDPAAQTLLDLLDLFEAGYDDSQAALGSNPTVAGPAWNYQVGRSDAFEYAVEVLKDALAQHADGIR